MRSCSMPMANGSGRRRCSSRWSRRAMSAARRARAGARMRARKSEGRRWEDEAGAPAMNAIERLRRLPFEGAVNFRDIGGYAGAGGRTLRWGQIYRSDSLSALTPADLKRLSALWLRLVCDL